MSNITVSNLLEVELHKCCGYGMCAEICPAVFALTTRFRGGQRDGEPRGTDEGRGRSHPCPEDVLKIIELEG